MRPRALVLVLLPILAIGLGACGSDVPDTSNPAKKPELVAPDSANALASTNEQQSSSSTASADSDSTSSGTTTQPQTQQQTPQTQTPAPSGGGTQAPQTQTPQTNNGGGAAAPQGGTQNFESFCKQNPGAC
jgi:hypothetical protein